MASNPSELRIGRAVQERRRWQIAAIGTAVALGLAGWFAYASIESRIAEVIRSGLVSFRDVKVETVKHWIEGELRLAQSIADEDEIRKDTAALIAILAEHGPSTEHLLANPACDRLHALIRKRVQTWPHAGAGIFSLDGHLIAAFDRKQVGLRVQPDLLPVLQRVREGEQVMSTPFRSRVVFPDSKDIPRADQPTMYSAVPIRGSDGQTVGAFCFLILPDREFTRILDIRPVGASGETIAFDRNGLMLSSSRFDDDLRRIGLLAPDDATTGSVLTVQLRDPQVDLYDRRPGDTPRTELPLTRMASSATRGQTGVDVTGYRDYRGVVVVGAWTWLEDLGFGIATKIDRGEAFQSLAALRTAYMVLIGLLFLTSLGVLFYSRISQIMLRRYHDTRELLEGIGQYRIESRIGEGGMGKVYLAHHALLRRPTALKVMRSDRSSEIDLARFDREVQLTSSLTHPNTVSIYDFGQTEAGIFYYAMEYLNGLPLNEVVRRSGPLLPARVIHLLQQVCGSLAEAHEQGFVHRDVKPANIMICARGGAFDFIKVLDFGLVLDLNLGAEGNLTKSAAVVGTPQYLTPEALSSEGKIDARSDIYSLGCVAYFMLTGRDVVPNRADVGWIDTILHDTPKPPSSLVAFEIEPKFEALVMSCLEKSPDARPQSAQALSDALWTCNDAGRWTNEQARSWWEEYGPEGWAEPAHHPHASDPEEIRIELRGRTQ